MKKVVLLGPPDATFSGRAWRNAVSSKLFPLPSAEETEIVSVTSNDDVLPTLLKNRGSWGIIAAKTQANGRVKAAFDSLVDLGVESYDREEGPPVTIMGAMSMRLSFALMARRGSDPNKMEGIIAHDQALRACKKRINELTLITEKCESNGLAAEIVAKGEGKYASYGALAPIEAARKYRLNVISDNFEDAAAYTTFYLLAPPHMCPDVNTGAGVDNRAVVTFRTYDHPGALHDVLGLFKDARVNLKHLHSVDENSEVSDFMFEAHVSGTQLEAFHKAIEDMSVLKLAKELTVFGPFPFRQMPMPEYEFPK